MVTEWRGESMEKVTAIAIIVFYSLLAVTCLCFLIGIFRTLTDMIRDLKDMIREENHEEK